MLARKKVGFDKHDNKNYRSECEAVMNAIVSNGGIIDAYEDDFVIYHTIRSSSGKKIENLLNSMIESGLIHTS